MKRARLLVLFVAALAAGGAALLARNFITPPEPKIVEKTNYDTVKVLVAKDKIGLGDTVSAEGIRWQEWPKAAANGDYITHDQTPEAIAQFSGSLARAPFLPGEPIKPQKLIKASDGGVMAAILPSGMRAISTPIREETAAGGFILPNDRVDVVVTRTVKREGSKKKVHVSETVLRNVRVLAIGQNIETKDGKKVVIGKTATLELSPRHVELLALARNMGDISLALRSLADASTAKEIDAAVNPFGSESKRSIKMLKYGVSSKKYGVN